MVFIFVMKLRYKKKKKNRDSSMYKNRTSLNDKTYVPIRNWSFSRRTPYMKCDYLQITPNTVDLYRKVFFSINSIVVIKI